MAHRSPKDTSTSDRTKNGFMYGIRILASYVSKLPKNVWFSQIVIFICIFVILF